MVVTACIGPVKIYSPWGTERRYKFRRRIRPTRRRRHIVTRPMYDTRYFLCWIYPLSNFVFIRLFPIRLFIFSLGVPMTGGVQKPLYSSNDVLVTRQFAQRQIFRFFFNFTVPHIYCGNRVTFLADFYIWENRINLFVLIDTIDLQTRRVIFIQARPEARRLVFVRSHSNERWWFALHEKTVNRTNVSRQSVDDHD